ncbi:hypothetical protein BYT27DRAFT_6904784 [Phlegmacium glaucopus]|nr:hypothetical protein BYT27DRAFT_6904784 [Phlegmacium glaucopus]
MITSWLIMGLGILSHPTNDRTIVGAHVLLLGTGLTTLVIAVDSANRKVRLTIAKDKLMDIMGIIIPFAYGVSTLGLGFWHAYNIWEGTESGTTRDWETVAAELTGGIPGTAKIVKFGKNPAVAAIVLGVSDAVGYIGSAVAYGMAC